MARYEHNGIMEPPPGEDSDATDSTFVEKVKSLLPSSLSKWFNSSTPKTTSQVRPRIEMEQEDTLEDASVIPPAKRLKPTFNIECIDSVKVNRKRLVLRQGSNSESGESTCGYSSMPRNNKLLRGDSGTAPTTPALSSNFPDTTLFNAKPGTSTCNRTLFDTSHDRILFNPKSNWLTNNSTITSQQQQQRQPPPPPPATITVSAPLASLSSRRPAFTGGPNTGTHLQRTLATRRIYNSPFYSGRTLYGGASAAASGKCFAQLQSREVQPKVDVDSGNTGDLNSLSRTARRILDTIESYSMDTRKVPNPSLRRHLLPLQDGQQQRPLFGGGGTPYQRLSKASFVQSATPTTATVGTPLQVPNIADLLRMKERLQASTAQVRATVRERESMAPPLQQQPVARQQASSGGKMRTKVCAPARQHKALDNHHGDDYNTTSTSSSFHLPSLPLPSASIQLPISALPKFDLSQLAPPIGSSSPLATPTVSVTKTTTYSTPTPPAINNSSNSVVVVKAKAASSVTTTMSLVQNKTSDNQFVFSKPLVLADDDNTMRHVIAVNNFKFSVPLSQKLHSQTSFNKFVAMTTTTNQNHNIVSMADCTDYRVNSKLVANSNKEKEEEAYKQHPIGGFGSAFKVATDQWECDVCMVRNKSDKGKCVACESPKPQSNAKIDTASTKNNASIGFLGKKWECDTCLVRNDPNATVCIACTSPAAKKGTVTMGNTQSTPITTNEGTGFASFYKPPTNNWLCDVCLISNSSNKIKCAACESPRPNLKGASATTSVAAGGCSSGAAAPSWECPSCMVRNTANNNKCVCCETLQPRSNMTCAAPSSSSNTGGFISKTNYGIIQQSGKSNSSSNSEGKASFTFGIPPNNQTASSISNMNKPPVISVFGNNNHDNTSTTTKPAMFSFGIPVAAITTSTTTASEHNLTSSSVSSTTATAPTTLGATEPPPPQPAPPSSLSSVPNGISSTTVTPAAATPGLAAIKFGTSSLPPQQPQATVVPATTTATPSSSATFAFGVVGGGGGRVSSSTATPNAKALAATTVLAAPSTTTTASFAPVTTVTSVAPPSTMLFANSATTIPPLMRAAAASEPVFAFGFGQQRPPVTAAVNYNTPAVSTATAAKPAIFSFGSTSAAPSPSNGAFSFQQQQSVAAVNSAQAPVFSFGNSASHEKRRASPFGNIINNNNSSGFGQTSSSVRPFGGGATVAPPSTQLSFGGGSSQLFGNTAPLASSSSSTQLQQQQQQLKNGGFDFSATAKPPATGGFNFAVAATAAVAAAVTAPSAGGLFSFGAAANGGVVSRSGNTAPLVGTAAAPPAFTFGAVSSSSGNSAAKPPVAITTPSASPFTLPTPAGNHTNVTSQTAQLFAGLRSPEGGGGMTGATTGGAPHQQRRIIRKAVRRTQPR